MIKIVDNRNKFDRIQKELSKLQGANLYIGIQGSEAQRMHPTPIGGKAGFATVADIGAFHEFGLGVPQRSFLRGWLDQDRAKVDQVMNNVVKTVTSGKMSAEKALEQSGALFVGWVQLRIVSRIPPPLATSTIARKKSSIPLIDTGLLRSSITYRVVFA